MRQAGSKKLKKQNTSLMDRQTSKKPQHSPPRFDPGNLKKPHPLPSQTPALPHQRDHGTFPEHPNKECH
jgi:hypothetical protein